MRIGTVGSLIGIDRSFRLPRHWSNLVLKDLGGLFSGEVINVSGWEDRDKEGGFYGDYFPNASAYYVSNYSGVMGTDDAGSSTDFFIDLGAPLAPELSERFDIVFNHTTLEHIYEARLAFGNLCTMARECVIVVVPFAQRTHGPWYGDFWRFSPLCLRRLFEENRFEVVFEAASPFSNAGVYLLFVGSRHPDRWRHLVPRWKPVENVGEWIGRSRTLVLTKKVARLTKSLKSLWGLF